MSPFRVRPIEERDLDATAVLAGRLVRMHHAIDPKRFLQPADPESGYRQWFAKEMARHDVVLLVGESRDGRIAGYAYGKLEPRSYYDLLDAHGALHDIFVDEGARESGLGEALVREMVRRLGALGAPRVVLSTAVENAKAQRLFAKVGFRPTMLEMTCEAEAASAGADPSGKRPV